MSKLNNILNTVPDVLKYILVGLVVVFISYLYPNRASFSYEFKQGSTWNYDDLKAPFDFALLKSDSKLDDEREQIASNYTPFYKKDLSIQEVKIQNFVNDISDLSVIDTSRADRWTIDEKDAIERFGISFLENAFAEGIIKIDSIDLNKNHDFVINLIENNTTRPFILSNINTISNWKNHLINLVRGDASIPKNATEYLSHYLEENIKSDLYLNEQSVNNALESISLHEGLFKNGDMIVGKGSIITDEVNRRLISFKSKYEDEVIGSRSQWSILIGYFLLTALLIGIFIFYLYIHHPKYYAGFSDVLFLLMWFVIYGYFVYFSDKNANLSTYIIPFAIVPIVVKNFYNTGIAIFTTLILVLIASFISSLGYEFTFLTLIAGMVAILSNKETRSWAQFFRTIILIFCIYVIGNFGLELIKEGDLSKFDWKINGWFLGNAFLTLLAYPLIPLLERIFGHTSSITLAELSDFNKPLIKELSLKARGTFQHSLQVSNLSEAAADIIGANSLLVKVAAMYHDIGKLEEPQYFIENQAGTNPHDQITPFESAKKIINHVTAGAAMAKKHRLPKVIIDFINSHHGTTRVEYFYHKQLELKPNGEFDESLFRYPGPLPISKEETILMIADSLEAASKSLKEHTHETISALVDGIIKSKVDTDQLIRSELSYKELEKCRDSFKSTLESIYHVRIAYPDKIDENNPAPSGSDNTTVTN